MRELPWRTRLLLWFAASPTLAGLAFAAVAKNPRKMVEGRLVAAEDRRLLRDERLSDIYVAMLTEGLRQGAALAKQEVALVFTKRWNVQWSAIKQPVYIFQGTQDPSLPFYRWLVREFPNARLTEFNGTHNAALAQRVWRAVIPIVQAADGG
jgi:pimeloyl-ACP methyl ester carboxylesterase